jgi:hypothetical protein
MIGMRTFALALVCLALGIGMGVGSSSLKFAGEVLPTKAFLAYLQQQRDPAARQPGPRLVDVGTETHDFGSMYLWAKGKHTFTVRNEGTEVLRLVMGKPTCSCTAMGTAGEKLEEGDSLELKPGDERGLTLDWEIKSSMEQFSQSAPFTTNDPNRPSLVLGIVGRVEDSIRRSRDTVIFREVPSSVSVTEDVLLETSQTDALKITEHRWLKPETAGFFDVRFVPAAVQDGAKRSSAVNVYITLKSGLPLGSFDQTLVVTTNMAPDVPPIQIPVQGTVAGDISFLGTGITASTQTFRMGDIPHGAGTKRTFHVLIKGPHRSEAKLSLAKSEPSNLRVQVGQPDSSNERVRIYPITVEVPADAPPINMMGEVEGHFGRIVLDTTHPTIKQLEVRVLYLIRE